MAVFDNFYITPYVITKSGASLTTVSKRDTDILHVITVHNVTTLPLDVCVESELPAHSNGRLSFVNGQGAHTYSWVANYIGLCSNEKRGENTPLKIMQAGQATEVIQCVRAHWARRGLWKTESLTGQAVQVVLELK